MVLNVIKWFKKYLRLVNSKIYCDGSEKKKAFKLEEFKFLHILYYCSRKVDVDQKKKFVVTKYPCASRISESKKLVETEKLTFASAFNLGVILGLLSTTSGA